MIVNHTPKRLVHYLSILPITEKVKKDFFINEISEKEYFGSVLDLSKLVGSNYRPSLNLKNLVVVEQYSQLKQFLKCHKDDIYILILGFYPETLRIFYYINRYSVFTIYFSTPGFIYQEKNKRNYYDIIRRYKKIIPALLYRIWPKIGFFKPFNLVFYSGNNQKEGLYAKSKKMVPINTQDYGVYQAVLASGEVFESEKPYCVFIDSFLPYHPDAAFTGLKTVSPEPYFKELNNLFDQIEKTFHIDVIISEHPKADYKQNPYSGRKMMKGQTPLLIQNCEFVLHHFSVAACLAFFFQKPIFFVYTKGIQTEISSFHFDYMHAYAKRTGRPCFLAEYGIEHLKDRSIDVDQYQQVISDYFASVQNEKTVDIVLKEIESLADHSR